MVTLTGGSSVVAGAAGSGSARGGGAQVGPGSAGQVALALSSPQYLLCCRQTDLPVLVLLRHLLPCWGQTGLPVLLLLPPPCLRLLQHPPLCLQAPGRRDRPWGDTRGLAGAQAREQRGTGIWALTCGRAGRAALGRQVGVRCGCQGSGVIPDEPWHSRGRVSRWRAMQCTARSDAAVATSIPATAAPVTAG